MPYQSVPERRVVNNQGHFDNDCEVNFLNRYSIFSTNIKTLNINCRFVSALAEDYEPKADLFWGYVHRARLCVVCVDSMTTGSSVNN